jgi:2-C-methyl-D-erythritol 4-phosphate cytidylyltransferase
MKSNEYAPAGVVIVAAGTGSRMNMDANKQYVEICGKPVLARTIQAFEDCGRISEIVVVVNEKDIIYCKQNIVERYGFEKVKVLVSGGGTRQESVARGLGQVGEDCGIILIHDGARPFIDAASIASSIDAAEEFGAACVAVPVKDTVKSADSEDFVNSTPDRSRLWSIQTPQAFKADIIKKAHRIAAEEGFSGTDDAVLAERLGHRLKLVMGSYFNIKITTQEDLVLAEAIAEQE